jgi:MscS family membrane protein
MHVMIRFLLIVLLLAPPALAQDPPNPTGEEAAPPAPVTAIEVDKRFASPRATITTFLTAMGSGGRSKVDWSLAGDCLNLTEDEREGDFRTTCRLLKECIDRVEFIYVENLPGKAEVAAQEISVYRFFPRPVDHAGVLSKIAGPVAGSIELARDEAGRWLFTGETVDGIDKLYAQLKPLPRKAGSEHVVLADFVRDLMPAKLKKSALLIEYWQWLALLLTLLVGFILDYVVKLLIRRGSARLTGRQLTEERREAIARAAKPFGLLAMGLLWVGVVQVLDLPPTADKILGGAARVFAVLAGTWSLWRLADLVCTVLEAKASRTQTKMDDVLIPLVRRALKLFILVFGVIYGAEMLNINMLPLLASLSIGGIAFGFAARDTIENFFGSVAVVIDRPFHVGDWVVIGDTEGTVESVGFRSTRIRTFYNSLVTVPNANLVRAVVDNYGERKYRRWKTNIGIQYDTPPETIVAFTEGIRELVRSHPYTRKDYFQVYLNEFADSSLQILLYIFHEVPDWSTELRERERIFLDIIRLADQLGVQFAFPTQTVHLFREKHGPYETRHKVPRSITDRRAQVAGVRAAQNIISNQTWVAGDKPQPVIFKAWPRYVEINPETGQPLDPAYKSQIEDTTSGG